MFDGKMSWLKQGAQSYYLRLIAFPETINSDTNYRHLFWFAIRSFSYWFTSPTSVCTVMISRWRKKELTLMRRKHLCVLWTRLNECSKIICFQTERKGNNCNDFAIKYKLNNLWYFAKVHDIVRGPSGNIKSRVYITWLTHRCITFTSN